MPPALICQSPSMDAFGNDVTNFTLAVVKDMEVQFRQSETAATIEVGVAIGAVASVIIILCIFGSTRACLQKRRGGLGPFCCKPLVSGAILEHTPSDDEDAAAHGAAEGAAPQEEAQGAYRSESDSEDEGESVRVAREAQKRARAMGAM